MANKLGVVGEQSVPSIEQGRLQNNCRHLKMLIALLVGKRACQSGYWDRLEIDWDFPALVRIQQHAQMFLPNFLTPTA